VLLSVWAEVGEHMRTHLDSYTIAEMVRRVSGNDGVLAGAEAAALAEASCLS
jgi:DNA-binding IscR family transcriptional regulator